VDEDLVGVFCRLPSLRELQVNRRRVNLLKTGSAN